jgi:hypothetical protein
MRLGNDDSDALYVLVLLLACSNKTCGGGIKSDPPEKNDLKIL